VVGFEKRCRFSFGKLGSPFRISSVCQQLELLSHEQEVQPHTTITRRTGELSAFPRHVSQVFGSRWHSARPENFQDSVTEGILTGCSSGMSKPVLSLWNARWRPEKGALTDKGWAFCAQDDKAQPAGMPGGGAAIPHSQAGGAKPRNGALYDPVQPRRKIRTYTEWSPAWIGLPGRRGRCRPQ
jgi:hypothetical protein